MDWWIDVLMDWWMIRSMDGWMDRSIDQCIDGWIDWCIDGWIDRLIDRWIDQSMDRSIEWWMDGSIDGSMDRCMDVWIDQMIYESMDRWTVHCHPSPIFFDPPGHHWHYRQQYLPPSKGYCQRGMSLFQIRISCPTGILVFFGMEEFVRDGGRRQPSRVDRNNELM